MALAKPNETGRCGLAYVLGVGRDNDPREPMVICGNPVNTQRLIECLPFASPFFSVEISFEPEAVLTPSKELQAIRSYERALLPGRTPGIDFDRVWVRHLETMADGRRRVALHGIYPKLDLRTTKRLDHYIAQRDFRRMHLWQRIFNETYGYADPDDPARKRDVSIASNRLPKSVKEIFRLLETAIYDGIEQWEIRSRADLISFLEGTCGCVIKRQQKKYITIIHADHPKPIRLRGGIYELNPEDPRKPSAALARAIETASGRAPDPIAKLQPVSLEERREFQRLVERHAFSLSKRYGGNTEKVALGAERTPKELGGTDRSSPPGGDREKEALGESIRGPKRALGKDPFESAAESFQNPSSSNIGDSSDNATWELDPFVFDTLSVLTAPDSSARERASSARGKEGRTDPADPGQPADLGGTIGSITENKDRPGGLEHGEATSSPRQPGDPIPQNADSTHIPPQPGWNPAIPPNSNANQAPTPRTEPIDQTNEIPIDSPGSELGRPIRTAFERVRILTATIAKARPRIIRFGLGSPQRFRRPIERAWQQADRIGNHARHLAALITHIGNAVGRLSRALRVVTTYIGRSANPSTGHGGDLSCDVRPISDISLGSSRIARGIGRLNSVRLYRMELTRQAIKRGRQGPIR